jgi:hypothetical protein
MIALVRLKLLAGGKTFKTKDKANRTTTRVTAFDLWMFQNTLAAVMTVHKSTFLPRSPMPVLIAHAPVWSRHV